MASNNQLAPHSEIEHSSQSNNEKNSEKPKPSSSEEHQLKKNLLLLATLVATVTYAAGLNLPGGAWQEDTQSGHHAGDPILHDTHHKQYLVFYYCNATAFAASLVVSLLLLLLDHPATSSWLRAVMVVDLLGLTGAYAAGTSRDAFTTICSSLLVSALTAYVPIAFFFTYIASEKALTGSQELEQQQHELLMVFAIFAATITYVAGLNPPGGFWRSTQYGHTAGDPVLLQDHHPNRYKAFFFCNTSAFVTALLIIILLMDRKLNISGSISIRFVALYGIIIVALSGLVGAYAAGSCRDAKHTAYVLGLVGAVLAYILLQVAITKAIELPELPCWLKKTRDFFTPSRQRYGGMLGKVREFIQLLAILVATITYQAGLDPPGGLWLDNGEGHTVGDPILLTTHSGRYKVFFYCNSAAFVASLVIVVMLQIEFLVRRHTLEAAMILDLFSLIGAYAVGSCRDMSTSIYIVALAGAVLIYVVIHIVFFTLDHNDNRRDADMLEKSREVLLLLAILAATLTYQAGLTPPGGFWEENDKLGHHAGDPVLLDNYPHRYTAFFYCNAASFMSSVALIVLLVNPNLYKPGIRCYALYVCMVAGMFGLMGAYAAGSSRHLKTSIYVLLLVAAVFVFVVVLLGILCRFKYLEDKKKTKEQEPNGQPPPKDDMPKDDMPKDDMPKYLMLLGILAASVTYLTGLKPPGGLWRDDSDGHSAGNPILYDIDKRRYNIFFYSNSTSFMASIVVIVLLLQRILHTSKLPLWPMHTVILLGMLALLIAYAAGSAREWGTSRNVIALVIPIVAFVAVCVVVPFLRNMKTQPPNEEEAHSMKKPPPNDEEASQ